jgi:hypothetical protein
MTAVFKMFWTTISSALSILNKLALSGDKVANVVLINATNFEEIELIEAQVKIKQLRLTLDLPAPKPIAVSSAA